MLLDRPRFWRAGRLLAGLSVLAACSASTATAPAASTTASVGTTALSAAPATVTTSPSPDPSTSQTSSTSATDRTVSASSPPAKSAPGSTRAAPSSAVSALACGLTDGTRDLAVAGATRQFDLYVPPELGSTLSKVPMLVLFHGFSSTAEAIAQDTGLSTKAPAAGVLLVVPQGIDQPASWHVDGSFGDEAFVDALLAELTALPCVDAKNVWLAGFSAGSAFAGVYGCAHAAEFAGLVMVSGLPPAICPEKDAPTVQITHGTADTVVPFGGGDQVVGNSTVPLAPVEDSAAAWALRSGCGERPATERLGETVLSRVTEWSGCSRGPTVSLVAVTGLGHAWPGAPAPAGQGVDGAVVDPGCVALRTMTGAPDDPFVACLA